ncbi:hypothetical protein [Halococcus agarilyticus]|uniref:hypothetical protein n=1 Tax=Halococcus agarilyticus TaxID=1232219 RepID=UPI001896669A|nr:hypothetical protein [Halococcus agarilyticus]
MTRADDLRQERNSADRDRDRYACEDCGLPIETHDGVCPECRGTSIVPMEDLIDPTFRE